MLEKNDKIRAILPCQPDRQAARILYMQPIECASCDAGWDCGTCLMLVESSGCPWTSAIIRGCSGGTSLNSFCDGNGSCGTSDVANNCRLGKDIYQRVECTATPPSAPPATPPSSPPSPPPPMPPSLPVALSFLSADANDGQAWLVPLVAGSVAVALTLCLCFLCWRCCGRRHKRAPGALMPVFDPDPDDSPFKCP